MSTTPPPPPGDFPGQPATPGTPPSGAGTPAGAPGVPPPPQGFNTVFSGTAGGGSAPPPVQKKRGLPGWVVALIVIGGLIVVCGGGGVLLAGVVVNQADDVIDEANESFDDAFGALDPSEYEVTFESCAASEFGLGEASGTITNRTGESSGFGIEVQFSDEAGVVVGTGFANVGTIGDGETAQFNAILGGTAEGGQVLQCEVTEVTSR